MAGIYGNCSNKSRGLGKKIGTDDEVPALIDSDISRQVFRKNWARLIQKIYPVNLDNKTRFSYSKGYGLC